MLRRQRRIENFCSRYDVNPENLIWHLDQNHPLATTDTDEMTDLSKYIIDGQDNLYKQLTSGSQPTVVTTSPKHRDYDGAADHMHQKVYDTNQGAMTFVADGGTAEFRDAGQNFADWETTSGNAAYMLVVTTNNGVSWAYCGASNNAGLDIDCYSNIGLTTRGWKNRTTPQATPDTAASYEVLKTLNQITDVLSGFLWVKPDDGQPAANDAILAKWRVADGFRSFGIMLLNTGKIRINLSGDGTDTFEGEDTDDAFLDDGQETWHCIGFVYNGTTVVVYGDGVALASTTRIGGIPASLHDTSEKLTIGALSTPASYFAGLIGPIMGFSREVFGDEVKKVYNVDAQDFGRSKI